MTPRTALDHRRLARASAARSPPRSPPAAGGSSSTPATPTGSPPPSPASPRPTWSPPSPGDVADPAHRAALAAAVGPAARPAGQQRQRARPQPAAPASPTCRPSELRRVLAVNTVAPLALVQAGAARAARRPAARVLHISSDAAVEAYAGWGGYGASKAALDQLTAVLAVEHPELRIYAVDPGDMATDMHQAAVPRRGHQRPAGPGDRRPGAAAP